MSPRRDIRPREIADPYAQRDHADENDSVPQGDGADRAYPNAPDFCCDQCGRPLDERESCPECD